MNKIIFVYQNFFEDRDYERYGIDYFIRKGYRVEVWSMIHLLAKSRKVVGTHTYTCCAPVLYPKSMAEVKSKIKSNRRNIFILLVNYRDTMKLRKEIYRNHIVYYELKICAPLMYAEEFGRWTIFQKIKWSVEVENKKAGDAIISCLTPFFERSLSDFIFDLHTLFNPPKAIFYSTKWDRFKMPFVLRHCRNYALQTLDYDLFLKLKKTSNYESKSICFIDGGDYINHPDTVLFNKKKLFNEKGIQKIRMLIERLELVFPELKVVIAGHPRVKYSGNEFGDREIIQFKTPELIRSAEIVVATCTTAWNYIILYDKPVLLYSLPETSVQKDIQILENYLKIKCFDFWHNHSDKELKGSVKRIDPVIRKKYIREYIKGDDCTERPFFETVADIIL